MSKKIQLSDHFTYGRLLRFVMPSILMILCTSVYTIVDGFFVSNYVGKTAFAALNLVWPVLMAVSTIGFLIGTGGCALVSKTLGEGNRERANQYFSMLITVTFIGTVILSAIGFLLTPQIWVQRERRCRRIAFYTGESCLSESHSWFYSRRF